MTDVPDLFLSHNTEDKPLVREIAEVLRRRRFKPWLDQDDLVPGRPWQDLAEQAIKTCRAAAVFVGQSGLGPWERVEARALLTQAVKRGLPVIPVLLPGAPKKPDLPLFLVERTWVDLRTVGVTAVGIDLLVWGITGKRPRSKSKPRKKSTTETALAVIPSEKTQSEGPPPFHNLPYPPLGDLLKGRDNDIWQLAERFQSGGRAVMQAYTALYGLSGVGKTRLAVEYAWQFGYRYRAAFFIQADSPESLNIGLYSLAFLLDLPQRQAQAVLRWLRANPGWLLILDNVDSREAEQAIAALLPNLDGGHVLITSRLKDWPSNVYIQELDTIPLDGARSFLLERTEGKRRTAPDDEAKSQLLAEKLTGLPLALEQASSYIVNTRITFSEYLRLLEEEKGRVQTEQTSLAATWETTLDRLKATSLSVLRLATFLKPGLLPERMFSVAAELVREAISILLTETEMHREDWDSIPEALGELESYSLISRQNNFFSVHSLVQKIVQDRIPEKSRNAWWVIAQRISSGNQSSGSLIFFSEPTWSLAARTREIAVADVSIMIVPQPR